MNITIKHFLSLLLLSALFMVVFPFSVSASASTALYVATDGSDDNKGTINAPLKTLEKARDTIRAMKNKPSGGITVYVRGGTYRVDKTFELTEEDSGTDECPVTYRNYGDEKVTFVGGASLAASDFKPVTDENIIKRLPEGVSDKVFQADLKAMGITEYGEIPISYTKRLPQYKKFDNPPELFFNDKSMTLARWPNDTYAKVEEVVHNGGHTREWEDDKKGTAYYVPESQRDPYDGFIIKYSDERMDKWVNEPDMRLYGYWYVDWYTEHMTVDKIDTQRNTIKTSFPTSYGIKAGQQYYAHNLLCELDAPGEYYLDRDTGILYFYPPEDMEGKEIGLSLMAKHFISMKNCYEILIQGFDFNYTRGAVIHGQGLNKCYVVDCEFRNTGGGCVNFSGCKDSIIANIKGYQTNGGCSVSGGNLKTLEPGNNQILNCYFDSYDRITKTYNPPVNIGGVGNRAAYNEIMNADHMALGCTGNDHIFEYNDIHDVLKNCNDSAAWYAYISVGNYSMLGTIIRYNYFHHLGTKSKGGTNLTDAAALRSAVYMDGYQGNTIYGNVFYKAESGILHNGGWGNNSYNNIFLDVDMPFTQTDGNGMKPQPTFENYMEITDAYKKYPYIMEQMTSTDFKNPKYCRINNNLSNGSTEINFDIRYIPKEYAISIGDYETPFLGTVSQADFKDYENEDFTLREDSNVLKTNPEFEYADFSKIGNQEELEELAFLKTRGNALGGNGISGGESAENSGVSADFVGLMIGSSKAISKGKTVNIDENPEIKPLIKNNSTFVPLRFIAEAMDSEVTYSETTKDIIIKRNDSTVILTVNSERMFIDGEEYTLKTVPEIMYDRTMIPLRAVSEALGLNVSWDMRGLIIISESTVYSQMAENANSLTNIIDKIIN